MTIADIYQLIAQGENTSIEFKANPMTSAVFNNAFFNMLFVLMT